MFKKACLAAIVTVAGGWMTTETAEAGRPFYRGRGVVVAPVYRPPVRVYRPPVYSRRPAVVPVPVPVYRPPVYRSYYGGGYYGGGYYGRSSRFGGYPFGGYPYGGSGLGINRGG